MNKKEIYYLANDNLVYLTKDYSLSTFKSINYQLSILYQLVNYHRCVNWITDYFKHSAYVDLILQLFNVKNESELTEELVLTQSLKMLTYFFNESLSDLKSTNNEENFSLVIALLKIIAHYTSYSNLLDKLLIVVDDNCMIYADFNDEYVDFYGRYQTYFIAIADLNTDLQDENKDTLSYDETYDYMLFDKVNHTLMPYHYLNLIKVLFDLKISIE